MEHIGSASYGKRSDLAVYYRCHDCLLGWRSNLRERAHDHIHLFLVFMSTTPIVGHTHILVNPYSVEELTEAMSRVLTDRTLHDKLAHAGTERAKLFSWERTAKETLAVYECVASGKR